VVERGDERPRRDRRARGDAEPRAAHRREGAQRAAALRHGHEGEQRERGEDGAPGDLRRHVERELALEHARRGPRDRRACHVQLPAAAHLPRADRRRGDHPGSQPSARRDAAPEPENVGVPGARYIGRANLAKRLGQLDGAPGRAEYRAGSARLELEGATLTVTPPFGLRHEGEYDRVRAGPLLEALERDHVAAALLVRMGGYAVGVFEGERLVVSKVGSRFVKGRHKKGGSSSNRFRRRRGEQERELVDEAAAQAARVLGPWQGRVDRVALGGDRSAVRRVLAARADLGWLEPLALERFFDVPEPRRRVLDELPYQLYAAKVVEEER
jgi:hypothetical protein